MQYLFHLEGYVGHFVCLFVGWGTYVWHCVCFLWDLCWALGLSVGCGTYVCKWLGYLEQAQLINCFWNIW